MATWLKDELRRIAAADDLPISPFREDGLTYGTPAWIWSVAVDDADRRRRHDEGGHLGAGGRADQGPHR
jgi:hypothetical protein